MSRLLHAICREAASSTVGVVHVPVGQNIHHLCEEMMRHLPMPPTSTDDGDCQNWQNDLISIASELAHKLRVLS
jgi:hypothetical protein